jgi:hypothetical protein
MSELSDHELMAFADGQLDDACMAKVAAIVAEDAAMAAEVERLRAGTAALRGAFRGQLDLEAPQHLAAMVEKAPASNVAMLKPRRAQAPLWAAAAASAACLLTGFGVGSSTGAVAGLFAMRGENVLVAAGDLRGALEHSASGAGAGDVRIALSFPQASGGYCRVFRIDRANATATAGLACEARDDWTIVALGEAGAGGGRGAIEQAGADIPEAVLQAAANRQGGDALDARAEAAALNAHWPMRH